MTRLQDELDRDLSTIAERVSPSPDAWEQIQQRIAARAPTQETEIIMLTDNTMPTRRWPLVVAAAAVALVVAGIALIARDDGELPADDPTPAPTLAPVPDADDATPLPPQGSTIDRGRYSAGMLGVPVVLDVPDVSSSPWTVDLNNQAAFSIRTERGFVGLTRIGSFYDAAQAQDQEMSGLGSIPPDAIDSWIDASGIVVDDTGEPTIGRRPAQFRVVRAPDGSGADLCPEDAQPCVLVGSGSADRMEFNASPAAALNGQAAHAFWIIDMDDFEPLGIWAAAFDGDLDTWLSEITPLIDSIELGEPAPATEGGAARLSTFGTVDGALPAAGERVSPGTYSTDAIGTPVTLNIGEGQTNPWTLVSNDSTGIQLITDEMGTEFVAIGRIGSWFDADEARREDTRGLGGIPADGIDTWIEANGVIVVEAADIQVGGRDAKYRLVRLDTTPGATAEFCPESEAPCLWAVSGSADLIDDETAPVPFGRDRVQAIWSVDMGEFEPVFIFAAANLADDGPWFANTVQPIVDSVQFGDPAPAVEGGTARVPERLTVEATMTVTQTGERPGDEPWPVERTGSLRGDIVGTYDGAGISSPNGAEVTLDWTMDATIEGLGSGTLTLRSYWFWSGDGATTATDHVISGTGDLEGVTGFGSTTQTSDFPGGEEYTADIELHLAPPAG